MTPETGASRTAARPLPGRLPGLRARAASARIGGAPARGGAVGADRAIGRLAGEGRRLPNPHLLIRPFIRREAVLSSRIEGTQATLGELLAAEAGAAVERSPADLREVGNYVAALEYGVERLRALPSRCAWSASSTRAHAGRARRAATPGEFRRSQNWIGARAAPSPNAAFVPPPHTA